MIVRLTSCPQTILRNGSPTPLAEKGVGSTRLDKQFIKCNQRALYRHRLPLEKWRPLCFPSSLMKPFFGNDPNRISPFLKKRKSRDDATDNAGQNTDHVTRPYHTHSTYTKLPTYQPTHPPQHPTSHQASPPRAV